MLPYGKDIIMLLVYVLLQAPGLWYLYFKLQCAAVFIFKRRKTAMETVPEIFGSKVFDDRVMKARLSAEVYNSLKKNDTGRQRTGSLRG